MGYTHYWTFVKPKRGTTKQVNEAYLTAVLACSKIIKAYSTVNGGLAGYSAHAEPGQYGGVKVNGSREDGHEDFCLREHLSDYFKMGTSTGDFCKTARKPYDAVVVACLVVLNHYLGGNIIISSDGDSIDWIQGLELARKMLEDKSIKLPSGVKTRIGLVG